MRNVFSTVSSTLDVMFAICMFAKCFILDAQGDSKYASENIPVATVYLNNSWFFYLIRK